MAAGASGWRRGTMLDMAWIETSQGAARSVNPVRRLLACSPIRKRHNPVERFGLFVMACWAARNRI